MVGLQPVGPRLHTSKGVPWFILVAASWYLGCSVAGVELSQVIQETLCFGFCGKRTTSGSSDRLMFKTEYTLQVTVRQMEQKQFNF